ncbi:MAG: dTDP-glucose 4,6-dehydratase [Chitinivibrionales bacterium]|nr:dTDP-glucose 4,6-dehydratase [Chitinivibrionales bacterium]
MKKILVTGGCGFIGSNFVLHMLENHPDYHLVNLDALTYAGNPDNLRACESDARYTFVKGSIADAPLVTTLFDEHGFEAVVNIAAETHVDRSITGPMVFTETNTAGTHVLLEQARRHWHGATTERRFVQVSTDEVYGALGAEGLFTEQTPLAPNSPYSASKAAGDLMARAYFKTYALPVVITRCSNNYGPYQFPEKFIPLMIARALADERLPVYGDGLYTRDWLFVADHCAAIDRVLHEGAPGQVYNVGGNNEQRNIDVVKRVLSHLGKPETLIEHVTDRPGHDRRYAIDASKIRRELGWEPATDFDTGLAATIDWYVQNRSWWEKLLHNVPAR